MKYLYGYFCRMERQRRAWGTGKDNIALHVQIDPASYAKIDAVAGGMGISKARALDMLLQSIDVDEHGRPDFYTGEMGNQKQKELPLSKTA